MVSKKKWIFFISVLVLLITGLLVLDRIGTRFANRLEPYLKEQAISYLRQRFDSEVELGVLRIHIPEVSAIRILLNRGQGILAKVEGENLLIRHKGRKDIPAMFAIKRFAFDVDLGTVVHPPATVALLKIDEMEINIPPKSKNGDLNVSKRLGTRDPRIMIKEIVVTGSTLAILPRDPKKTPLRFELHKIRLQPSSQELVVNYEAMLKNARPPGDINSRGKFGPWTTEEPGDTPLTGEYDFKKADLSVFRGIAGHLDSTGHFDGTLDKIHVIGKASVPEFHLKNGGKPLPLTTSFEVMVDGTNGNTILQPVTGSIGATSFTTTGGVVKHEKDPTRRISLDVTIPKGSIYELLRFATKGTPGMDGTVSFKGKIEIPPLSGKVREKLILDGNFTLSRGRFLRAAVQEKVDTLSRRGQGQPENRKINDVFSQMKGVFHLENQAIVFRRLSFYVSGARVDLTGTYNVASDLVNLRGTLKLDAKVSQTMTGWKRWVLKPVDPFFAKEGAGTFLKIRVEGKSDNLKIGRDRG